MINSDANQILRYHQCSKHRLNAYAKGPEVLDWDDQPQPFRSFNGCQTISLPKPGAELNCQFADLDHPELIPHQALNLNNLGLLLELSFGLSAWKHYGPDRWALRCNPSSGNLHPTEVYLLTNTPNLLPEGVYHYHSYSHSLQQRCQFQTQHQDPFLLIGLSSIPWREAWKYGERAFRYCQHDIGHALAALSFAAASLGWTVELCSEVADADIAEWLGLNRPADFVAKEAEYPELLCRLNAVSGQSQPLAKAKIAACFQQAIWFGKAQALSDRHFYQWPIIDEIVAQTTKPTTPAERWLAPALKLPRLKSTLPASQLIRQRRSAQRFNSKAQAMPLANFQRIMLALLPNTKPPFTAWNWPPQINLLLFIHNIESLEPGLYLLIRNPLSLQTLQHACLTKFSWQPIPGPWPLFQLSSGNLRQACKALSCHQAIASDGAFTLGMLANFAENIAAENWRYRRLFWECGLLGQILYLEAEAALVRGTGIGCYFDDMVHEVLGLTDQQWQSLYHFTIGMPVEDPRLQTFPAYQHLENNDLVK